MRTILPCILLFGCDEMEEVETTVPTVPIVTDTIETTDMEEPPDGACGDVTHVDMRLLGVVNNEQGNPAPFAEVSLEDRGWEPGTLLGFAYADLKGRFDLPITQLADVEGCWETILNYTVVAELGPQSGEFKVNSRLQAAITNGSLVADISDVPINMSEPAR